jgi:hypothetical protein
VAGNEDQVGSPCEEEVELEVYEQSPVSIVITDHH